MKLSGVDGEKAAEEALRRAGYAIIDRNVRTPLGEIDLLARQGGCLCVVEVKARATDGLGGGFEAVTPSKQAKLRALASALLQRREFRDEQIRFDVVAVTKGKDGRLEAEILADAFQ